jgi:Cu/Ag efflux pump CusA
MLFPYVAATRGERQHPTPYVKFESAAEARQTLLILGAGVVVGIFLLLTVALRSAGDAALVMLNLPLALVTRALAGGQPGSELQTPMAIAVLWGLLSSTALNMLVVQALYLRFGAAGWRGGVDVDDRFATRA